MFFSVKLHRSAALLLLGLLAVGGAGFFWLGPGLAGAQEDPGYIKWVDFTPTYAAMAKALELDVAAHKDGGTGADFVELLA